MRVLVLATSLDRDDNLHNGAIAPYLIKFTVASLDENETTIISDVLHLASFTIEEAYFHWLMEFLIFRIILFISFSTHRSVTPKTAWDAANLKPTLSDCKNWIRSL